MWVCLGARERGLCTHLCLEGDVGVRVHAENLWLIIHGQCLGVLPACTKQHAAPTHNQAELHEHTATTASPGIHGHNTAVEVTWCKHRRIASIEPVRRDVAQWGSVVDARLGELVAILQNVGVHKLGKDVHEAPSVPVVCHRYQGQHTPTHRNTSKQGSRTARTGSRSDAMCTPKTKLRTQSVGHTHVHTCHTSSIVDVASDVQQGIPRHRGLLHQELAQHLHIPMQGHPKSKYD